MSSVSLRAAFLVAALVACGHAVAATRIDLVLVEKAAHKLHLMADGQPVRTYDIALGAESTGHKQRQGDERTPEGMYVLDWRNAGSAYTLSIHISYPNPADRAAAAAAGYSPGGDIMIHGQPRGFGWWSWLLQRFDWTDGCIAVANDDMREIWDMVGNGTPIEIRP